MSTTGTAPPAAVVDSTGKATSVTPMPGADGQKGGSLLVTAMPLAGGKRKSRKLSKKVLKMLKKMGPSKVVKMIKKGGEVQGATGEEGMTAGRRHRRGSKKTRRHSRKY